MLTCHAQCVVLPNHTFRTEIGKQLEEM